MASGSGHQADSSPAIGVSDGMSRTPETGGQTLGSVSSSNFSLSGESIYKGWQEGPAYAH
jgi:hypothetical protein